MENNLVELKFDNVNRFFDELKIKYENEYQNNKTITEKIYVSNLRRVLEAIPIILFMIAFCWGLIWFIESKPNYTGHRITDEVIKLANEGIIPLLATFVSVIFAGWANLKLIRAMTGTRPSAVTREVTKTLSRKKYFAKIKAEMLYYVRYNLNYSIREGMLIFDKYGMVIGPDLSTNENKRVFSEAERKLEQKNE